MLHVLLWKPVTGYINPIHLIHFLGNKSKCDRPGMARVSCSFSLYLIWTSGDVENPKFCFLKPKLKLAP